jgi:hypothetical protein
MFNDLIHALVHGAGPDRLKGTSFQRMIPTEWRHPSTKRFHQNFDYTPFQGWMSIAFEPAFSGF